MGNLPSSQMKGAKILIESLKKAEVEYIFGVQGGAAMPIFDELYDAEGIKLITMRHEQGTAHAADGYARATGKVARAYPSAARRNSIPERSSSSEKSGLPSFE